MTTNSFGGPLPRFDFPAQPAPAISRMARVSKALPIVLVTATIAAAAIKTIRETQESRSPIPASMAFGRPSAALGLVPQGQGSVDNPNIGVGTKPNK
ncbi:hypothetical protein FALBO_14769 [Fusarium albosuccineum]|uniref:Uncharacterized protein n=2 Tax=Fusarium decemcellulare species complex TaxID=1329916 RepID=A0A8H4PFC7_9HYPO|nr:hypothetical protein FALBO_14769 [Fusarium albosuccineum]KAJ3546408.1 hypothetical protein NM208_g2015 [Fusarium decemcellulare]